MASLDVPSAGRRLIGKIAAACFWLPGERRTLLPKTLNDEIRFGKISPHHLATVELHGYLHKQVKPLVNLDEQIGKTVGRKQPPGGLPKSSSYTPADARAWKQAFKAPSVPRGVYRFASHEEADAWLMKMLTRVRKISNPANPPSPTSADSARS